MINELDSDTQSTDDKEFIELKSDVPDFPLDGYVLVLFNGSATSSTGLKSYFAIDLDGVTTDVNGIALIGNELVSPVPVKIFSSNIIQNGPDAVALYLGSSSDFPNQTLATSSNLVSALAYGSAQTATELMELLNTDVQYDENANNLVASQSIQRRADGIYETKNPTPGANNDGTGITFNGIGVSSSTAYEIGEGAAITLTFTTQIPASTALNFNFSLVGGDGFGTSDFSGTTFVTIPSGSTAFSTTITITDDNLNEGDETFRVRFGTLPSGYNRLNDNLPFLVLDNDFVTAGYGTPLNPTFGLVAPNIPAGYYDSLEGKAGAELKQAIQDIIANPVQVHAQNYGDITTMLQQADVNPMNSNQVWLMYVEQGRGKYKFQSTASNTGSWNREHIFPQSRGGFADGTSTQADGIDTWLPTGPNDLATGHADGHHIRAEDGPENSARNNRDYGSDYNGPVGNQGSWKGDVARALFYMAVRYNGLQLVAGNPDDVSGNKVMGDLISLLSWNDSDPADDFEMHRNNVIYDWQKNRNPFIDYPDLARYVFGSLSGQTWNSNLSNDDFSASRIVVYPNPMHGQFSVSGIDHGKAEVFSLNGIKVGEALINGASAVEMELPAGIYLARISSENASRSVKLIVK